MKYSIAFKDLPFEPEKRQVIYVENQYDERVNTLIKDNYKQIKWIFERARLDLIYLPMFFNDEETREKILYYAPYLTADIIEKAELRSSYLLGFMSHINNREKISSSFIYSPQIEEDEWVFQGQSVDIDDIDRNPFIRWLENFVTETEEELSPTIVRQDGRRYDMDIDEGISFRNDDDRNVGKSQVEYSSTPSFWDRIKSNLERFAHDIVEDEEGEEEYTSAKRYKKPSQSSLDAILDEDVRDTIEELERNIERLRLLGIPLAVIKEFVEKYETISRIMVTDDCRILLPDYNYKEVKMGGLLRAIYCLFLNHPEGIVLKRLEEHHRELANYYLQATGKKELSPRMIDSLNILEYPGNNNLNSVLSKIRMYFRNTIDEHLAWHYYIIGKPGEPYKIALEKMSIEFEDDYE